MKNLLILSLGVLLICSCEPEEPPVTPPSSPPSLTTAESALVNDWKLDSVEYYANGVLVQTDVHTDPINCHLNIQEAVYASQANSRCAVTGFNCVNSNIYWQLQAPNLNLHGILYYIMSSNATTLNLQLGSVSASGGGAYRYYLSD